jgi:hypothetical protein
MNVLCLAYTPADDGREGEILGGRYVECVNGKLASRRIGRATNTAYQNALVCTWRYKPV